MIISEYSLVWVALINFTIIAVFTILSPPSPSPQSFNKQEDLKIPIDVVYTWVNGSDPEFIRKLSAYLPKNQSKKLEIENRFHDYNALKYSLRSVEKYAPWVRNIYIVTNGQIPNWLNLNNSRVHLITHEDIFPNKSHLPTFSSPAIESHLFRIANLSKLFLYLNDDILFNAPIFPQDFITNKNVHKIRLDWPLSNIYNKFSKICDYFLSIIFVNR